jgi:predicted metalloprotease
VVVKEQGMAKRIIVILLSVCVLATSFLGVSNPAQAAGSIQSGGRTVRQIDDPECDGHIGFDTSPDDTKTWWNQYKSDVTTTLTALNQFWSTMYQKSFRNPFEAPCLFQEYNPLGTSPLGVWCGIPSMSILAGNAFYCSRWKIIAWDGPTFFWEQNNEIGNLAFITVLAHEYGHHIQSTSRQTYRSLMMRELQADCYAGVFVSYLASLKTLRDDDYLESMEILKQGGDTSYPWYDVKSHGTSLQRQAAFYEGYNATLADKGKTEGYLLGIQYCVDRYN